ncbi:MAG TPA: alpha-galactosidase [Ruminiclostridium sp.]|nr:alpha-galactosidase [Ruminiclostridium sp.]
MDFHLNSEYFHPILKEPPIAHAMHKWDEVSRVLSYEYNGRDIISIKIPGTDEVGYRHGSDGNLQSIPFVQQLYVMLDNPVKARMTLHLSSGAVNMRPKRAEEEQAIIGQAGRPLMYGVNGVYDITQDLLIDWNGCNWRWLGREFEKEDDGDLIAELEIELGPKPLFINLKMQYYRKHLGYSNYKPWNWRPNTKSVVGWCSWEAFRRDVAQDDIGKVSQFFSENLAPYGLEYIQLDDGYQTMPIPPTPEGAISDTWLKPNKRFPEGHEGIVSRINDNGLKAGIWINTNVINKEFAYKNADFFIKGKDDRPMLGEWIDFIYSCTDKCLQEIVAPSYKGLKEHGYAYFKVDALRHTLFDGLHEAVRQGIISNDDAEQKFTKFMECVRKSIGDDAYLLASWGEMSEVIGTADACRISMDANPTWAGIRMQLVESARWFHSQRILFLNDPDHICARAKLEWVRTVSSLVSLTGELYMLSDPLNEYDGERLSIIQKCIPTLETYTGETGPLDTGYPAFTWTKLHGFAVPRETPIKAQDSSLQDAYDMAGIYPTMNNNHPFSSLWAIHLNQGFRNWCVAARIATIPLNESEISLEQLNLEPADYIAFDFWAQECLGIVSEKLKGRALGLGECQIISLTKVAETPQFVASSRHVSMDMISVRSQNWESNTLKLYLSGIEGTKESYWFHIPSGYSLACVSGDLNSLHTIVEKDILKIDVEFISKEGYIELLFKTNY